MSYTVRRGDTLSSIASRHHVSLKALEHANAKLKNPNLIYVGEKLQLPGHKDSFAHHPAKHPAHPAAHHASRPKDPVKRLNQDLSHLHKANVAEKKAAAHEKKSKAALTHHTEARKTALERIDQQRQALAQQISSYQEPTTPGGTPTPPPEELLRQMAALGKKEVQTKDTFADRFAADRKAIAHDKKAVAHDKAAIRKARHQGLKDLRPAEYHLGLKQTNKDRKALGLKPVKHVVRPAIHNVVGGKVGSWIAKAQAVLKAHGVPLSKMNAHDINLIIQHESGGNPKAVNHWDSNAAAGHPSKGLMQTIGPTFNAYKLPGHGHILDPVDNIIAGVRYAISRYGSISNVPGVRNVHHGGSYVGY
jgi:LysM repeat protein